MSMKSTATQISSISPNPAAANSADLSAPATSAPMPIEAEVRADDLESGDNPGGNTGNNPDDNTADDRDSRIRRAAYDAFVRRGDQPGSEVDDWLEAERTVDAPASAPVDDNAPKLPQQP